MTKANANAAANAQEQQAAQQQILRDLLALGKKNGRLTLKEISDALSHLELSSEDIDKVYETLETFGTMWKCRCGLLSPNEPRLILVQPHSFLIAPEAAARSAQ